MQVVIDARMILPQMTGVGRYLLGLAGALGDLPGDMRIELWLQPGLPANHPIWQLQREQIKLRSLPINHMDFRQQWVLPLALRRLRPDLLHYPHFDLPWSVTGKVIATLHDLKYIARPDFFPHQARAKRMVILAMMTFTAHRARHVITDSEYSRMDIIRRLHIPPQKITAIHLGVESQRFSEPASEHIESWRRKHGLEDPFILFVGERRPHKNILGLLSAFQIFRHMTARPFHLVIAGKRYADYLEPEQVVEAQGLSDRVHFLDYVSDQELPLLYRSAEAFMLLSFYEGFGLPVLEAMAAGTPVVAARTTSLPEVVGEAGLLVPPEDAGLAAEALQQVVEGGEHREAYIARGLEQAHRFTWEQCACQTLSVYRMAARA